MSRVVLVLGVSRGACGYVLDALRLTGHRHRIRTCDALRGRTSDVVLYVAGPSWMLPAPEADALEHAELYGLDVRHVAEPATWQPTLEQIAEAAS